MSLHQHFDLNGRPILTNLIFYVLNVYLLLHNTPVAFIHYNRMYQYNDYISLRLIRFSPITYLVYSDNTELKQLIELNNLHSATLYKTTSNRWNSGPCSDDSDDVDKPMFVVCRSTKYKALWIMVCRMGCRIGELFEDLSHYTYIGLSGGFSWLTSV